MGMMNRIDNKEDQLAVTSQSYRDAMRQFAGAVHIVTTDGEKGRRGLTVSASCSLSDSPPTILVCLMRHYSDNSLFIENGNFCLNTLAGHHKDLSDAFAGRMNLTQEARFALTQWQTLASGAPALSDALACFDCRLTHWYEHATHYVLVGEVVALKTSVAADALLYLNRSYHTVKI